MKQIKTGSNQLSFILNEAMKKELEIPQYLQIPNQREILQFSLMEWNLNQFKDIITERLIENNMLQHVGTGIYKLKLDCPPAHFYEGSLENYCNDVCKTGYRRKARYVKPYGII